MPQLDYSGSPSVSGGNLQLLISGLPNQFALGIWSSGMASEPFAGGTRFVASPFSRTSVIRLSANGKGAIPLLLAPALIGTLRNYQVLMGDPSDPYGVGLTNALHVEFWP